MGALMLEWALLGVLIATAVWLVTRPGVEVEEPGATPERESAQASSILDDLGALNYGTASAILDAERRLLSRGPGVVPELFRIIERLDENSGSLTPVAQMRVEDIIVDFRLAGVLALRERLPHLRPSQIAYASALRVLERAGPMVFDALDDAGPVVRELFVDPLVVRSVDSYREYLEEYGPRLSPEAAQRLEAAVERATRRSGIRIVREEGEESAPEDVSARELLIRRLDVVDAEWLETVRRVRRFAPEEADDAVAAALKGADDSVPDERLAAAVRADSKAASRAVVELLGSTEPWQRRRAVVVSRALSTECAVIAACQAASRHPRTSSLDACGQMILLAGDDGARGLQEQLRASTDAVASAGAVLLAGRLPADGHTAALLKALERSPELARSVALAIELQGADAVVPLLSWTRQQSTEPPAAIRSTALRVRAVAERREPAD